MEISKIFIFHAFVIIASAFGKLVPNLKHNY